MGVIFTTTCKKKIYVTKSLHPDEWDITLDFGIDLSYSLWNDVRAKTDYWVTAKPRFGWETHVWIHCYGMVGEWIDLSKGSERRIRDDCCRKRFVLRLRKEDSCWLLPKTTEYFEYQRGVLRWKIWTFTQLSCVAFLCLVGVTEDCRSRLYGNVLIKKYPPPPCILHPAPTSQVNA